MDKIASIFAVGGVMYRLDARGQISILLIKKLGGYWTLPKGKLIPGESESEALAREVNEETGLSGEIGQAVCSVNYKIVKKGQTLRKQVTYYLIRITDGELRLSEAEQIIKAGWFSPQAAQRRLRRGRLRVILRHACIILRSSLV